MPSSCAGGKRESQGDLVEWSGRDLHRLDVRYTDFRAFSPSVPLKVFFDKNVILDGQYWQDVLRKGLRQSKVMIAFLSAAYFQSEWCRREWEEYILVEQSRTYPGEALTPIFIVAPNNLATLVPPSARDWWDDVTRRNAVVEIEPYWNQGRAALQQQLVVERIRRLEQNILDRVEHGRVLATVPRDIRGRNAHFVGRRKELAALRDALARFEMVGLCALNGVGGIGKSSLAREYAYLFRREYLGGQFEIDLANTAHLSGILYELVRLARDFLQAQIPYNLPESEQFDRARAAFNNLDRGKKVLLLLDNLNESAVELISKANRAMLPSAEKVHYLITSRADPRSLGGIDTISLDVLSSAEALDLLFRYRAFARRQDDPDYLAAREETYRLRDGEDYSDDNEWKAALAIVNRLGRHSLAVSLIGAYLGSYPDITYARFATEMTRYGIGLALEVVGSDDKVRGLIEHPEKLIGPLFERSVSRLSPLALRTLEYAAFLPPDSVPVKWLKELIEQDAEMVEHRKAKPFAPPPWEETLRTLAGLDYLKGERYARMHRVVQEVVKRRLDEPTAAARRQKAIAWIENRAMVLYDGHAAYEDVREGEAMLAMVRQYADTGSIWLVEQVCGWWTGRQSWANWEWPSR